MKYDKKDLREIRANSFASHFLMPVTMLNRLPLLDEDTAKHWAQQFRVSTAALAKALKDAGLIDDVAARRIRAVRVSRDIKVDPEAPEYLTASQKQRRLALLERGLSNHYVDLCFMAHDRELISTGRLAEMLRIDLSKLSEIGVLYGRKISHGI
jgi:Zn-dependent peptidase ImmA (M78 family)